MRCPGFRGCTNSVISELKDSIKDKKIVCTTCTYCSRVIHLARLCIVRESRLRERERERGGENERERGGGGGGGE